MVLTLTERSTEAEEPEEGKHHGLGKGIAFAEKAKYIRQNRKENQFFMNMMNHFNLHVLYSLTGSHTNEFETLYRLWASMLCMPMNPRHKYMPDEQELCSSRKRALQP